MISIAIDLFARPFRATMSITLHHTVIVERKTHPLPQFVPIVPIVPVYSTSIGPASYIGHQPAGSTNSWQTITYVPEDRYL